MPFRSEISRASSSRQKFRDFHSIQEFEQFRAQQLRLGHVVTEQDFRRFYFATSELKLSIPTTVYCLNFDGETELVDQVQQGQNLRIPKTPIWWLQSVAKLPEIFQNKAETLQQHLIDHGVFGLAIETLDEYWSKVLRSYRDLRYLEIQGGTLSRQQLLNIGTLHRLWYLELSSCRLTEELQSGDLRRVFAKLEQLHSLNLSRFYAPGSDNSANRELFHQLQSCKELYCLDLSMLSVSNPEVQMLADLKQLSKLSLNYGIFGDQAFATLAQLNQLEHLSLSFCQYLCAEEQPELRALDKLQSLALNHCVLLEDPLLAALVELPTLQRLDLSCCQSFTSTGLEALGACRELRSLSLLRVEATDANVLAALANLEELEYLDLERCLKIDDQALKHLQQCRSLRMLKVANCPKVSYKGLKNLISALPKLEILDLSGCPLSFNELETLTREKPTNLTLIDNGKARHQARRAERRRARENAESTQTQA